MPDARINRSALNKWLNSSQGPIQPAIRKLADDIAFTAAQNAPVDKGELRRKVDVVPTRDRRGIGYRIRFSANHARAVHQGTGPQNVSNPRKYRGRPGEGTRLHEWIGRKELTKYGFAISKKIQLHGTKPNPFLSNAVERILRPFNFRWRR